MTGKQRRWTHTQAQDLDLAFYQGYDPEFLLRKAQILHFVADHVPEFGELIVESGKEPVEIDESFRQGLRAEVHFAKYQQFEALFALLLAPFQPLPHWLYLATYRDMREPTALFLERNVRKLSHGAVDHVLDFIVRAVYSNFYPAPDASSDKFRRNLEDIDWLLRRSAQQYLDGEEYNAYKHGLRTIITGPAQLTINIQDSQVFDFPTADSLQCINTRKPSIQEKKNEQNQVFRVAELVTIHFDPLESVNDIFNMVKIASIVRELRLALLKGTKTVQKLTLIDEIKQDIFENYSKRVKLKEVIGRYIAL